MAKKNLWWAIRNFINIIDGPFDNFKHWLNGTHWFLGFKIKIRIPDWLMRGRDKPDK